MAEFCKVKVDRYLVVSADQASAIRHVLLASHAAERAFGDDRGEENRGSVT